MAPPKGSIAWNAGSGRVWTDKRGYAWLYVTENGRRVARRAHRVTMEAHLGRKLEPWELIHHKDGNASNNVIENLLVTDWSAHTAEHNKGARKSEDARRSMEAFALMREQLKRERAIKADLLAALIAMEAEKSDYMRINKLGDPAHQHTNKQASAVIAAATGATP